MSRRRVKESGPGIRMKRKPPGQPGARFGQNGNYLSELEAQPGGPEGRPHTTAGSRPIATTGRPQGVRPRSLNSDHAVSPNLPEIRREHPVPSPVSFSRTDSSPEVQRSGAAGILLGYESSWFNHAWYDNEGRMTSEAYPNSGPTYNYAFDSMGRINGMTDSSSNTLVSGITYGPAGQLLTATYLGYNETRQYNVLNQLTRLTTTGTGGIDIQYSYSATQNNGKITQMQDYVTGEQVSYTYDALLRLASAATTANPSVPQWGQSFYTYDGFGNLTDQTLTQGSGPDVHVTVNPANNQLTSSGHTYDANGNDTSLGSYDNENHMVTAGSAKYGYAPDGKRVWKAPDSNAAHEEFYFWSPGGQRLGTYKSTSPGNNAFTTASTNVYFGGRLIQAQGRRW